MPLPDYQALVTDLVRDDAGRVSATQLDDAIARAVERYSADRPREAVADLVGVSGNLLALPAAWESGFSMLRGVEHPVGRVPPVFIDQERWAIYQDPEGQKIMLLDSIESASTVRLAFSARHSVAGDVDTVPSSHRSAVARLAAADLCDQLAAVYAGDSDSTIAADHVAGQTRSQAYAARARDYRKQYQDQVGVQDKTAAPSGTVATIKDRDSFGRDRLFHPARSFR